MLGIVLPCIALFFIAVYALGFSAISGVTFGGIGASLLGLLCLLASVATSALTVRRMVRNYASAGRQFASLIWLGLVLPAIGYVLITIGPLSSTVSSSVVSTNGAPTLVLFVLGVLLIPTTALTHALNVRRIERSYGAEGFAALWALQQGQLTREYEYIAPFTARQNMTHSAGHAPQQQAPIQHGHTQSAPFQQIHPSQAQFPQAPLFHQPPHAPAPQRPSESSTGVQYLPPVHEQQTPIQLPPPHPPTPAQGHQEAATTSLKPEQPPAAS